MKPLSPIAFTLFAILLVMGLGYAEYQHLQNRTSIQMLEKDSDQIHEVLDHNHVNRERIRNTVSENRKIIEQLAITQENTNEKVLRLTRQLIQLRKELHATANK